jgi:hypothetical protein
VKIINEAENLRFIGILAYPKTRIKVKIFFYTQNRFGEFD